MNGFEQARTIEARAMVRLLPFLMEQSDGRFVLTDKGTLAPLLQQSVGDAIFNSREDGRLFSVEIKAEQRWTGNLFLETWSNLTTDDRQQHANRGTNPGWLVKMRADLLFYYFLDVDRLFVIDMFKLKRWAFGFTGQSGRIYLHREVAQGRYDQLNRTMGRVVPIEVLRRELPSALPAWSVMKGELMPEPSRPSFLSEFAA